MNKIFTFLFFILGFSLFGQGLHNYGAYLGISGSTVVTISGSAGHFINENSAKTKIVGGLYLEGNFTNSAIIDSTSGTITFKGDTTQSITSGSAIFHNVTFNNSNAGTDDIRIIDNMKVKDSGIFINGIVNYSGGILTFSDSATSNGGSASSFVNTPGANFVAKKGSNAFIFPIGEVSGSNIVWAPVGISATGVSSYITADYDFAASPNNYNICASNIMHHVSGIEHWVINSTVSKPDVTLYWKDGTRSGISNTADLVVGYHNGPCWESKGFSSQTGNNVSGSITSSVPFVNYGEITIGTKNSDNPLPVSLLDFSASCMGQNAKLQWTTASETNNSHFTIERSYDGISWVEITQIPGSGNSNQLHNYDYSDENFSDYTVYYRLKQTDFDGNVSYFSPVSVNCNDSDDKIEVEVYPIPFKDRFDVNIHNFPFKNAIIKIFDVIGNRITERNISEIQNHEIKTTFDLSNLAAGMYFVEISSLGYIKNIKIIKN